MNEQPRIPARADDDAAVRAVLDRLTALWVEVTAGRSSVEAIAGLFTEDASFVVGDGTYLRGRSEIAAYYRRMVEGHDGAGTTIRDTTVIAEADSVRFLGDDAAIMVGFGGILFKGETVVPPERRGIQTSVLTRQDGDWRVAAYQNTRIHVYPESAS
jgi:uncharacterized protein (TIGR02246 family)